MSCQDQVHTQLREALQGAPCLGHHVAPGEVGRRCKVMVGDHDPRRRIRCISESLPGKVELPAADPPVG